MCPLTVAIEFGGCLFNVMGVKPGKLLMYLRLRAIRNVETTGENNAACANATLSAGVADGVEMVFAECRCSGLSVSMFHRLFVLTLRWPLRIASPMNMMVHLWARKRTSHPASQSLPMESRDVLPRDGKRWAWVAVWGRLGMSRWHVCVDSMSVSSGSLT